MPRRSSSCTKGACARSARIRNCSSGAGSITSFTTSSTRTRNCRPSVAARPAWITRGPLRTRDRRAPRLAILIDSPSLNLRLAKQLKRRGITVVYFVSPQIWAWKRWRLGQLKARIDKMLCIFDFEEAIYKRAGIPVEYVGHPLVDTVEAGLPGRTLFAV